MSALKKQILFMVLIFSMSYCAAFEYNISVPKETVAGEWFEVYVNVSSKEEIDFDIYSYVYKGNESFGQGWSANKEHVVLEDNGYKEIILKDVVKANTQNGIYDLRVRMKFNESFNITESYSLRVLEKNSALGGKEMYIYGALVGLSMLGLIIGWRFR